MKGDTHEDGRVSLALEQGYRFRVRCGTDGGATILTDEPAPLGAGEGPDPTELLAAAVGNCLASSLLFCMRKARLDVRGLDVEVSTTTVRDPNGRLRIGAIGVELAPSVSAEVRGKMDRCLELFEGFCTVTQSVRRGIEVGVTVEPRVDAVPDAPPAPLASPPCAAAALR